MVIKWLEMLFFKIFFLTMINPRISRIYYKWLEWL